MEDKIRNSIKILTRTYYDYQRERISLDGRMGQKKDGSLKSKAPPRDDTILVELYKRRKEVIGMEQAIEKQISKEVHEHPLWEVFLKHVKGCGEMMAAVLISEIDIRIATTVSKLWQFGGLNPSLVYGKKVKNGRIVVTRDKIPGDRKTKGYLCPYNQFLKAKLLGVLGSGFLKKNSDYRVYYDNMRKRLEAKDWGKPSKNPTKKDNPKALHQHNAANRYTVKMFLKDLYVAWRTLEGLTVRKTYQEEYLGYSHEEGEVV